jgi:tetratricopeptide (TPR) repeat protein
MRCWRFVFIAILFLDFFKAEAQSDQLLVDFQLFRDSVFSGMKTNRAYDKLRAAEIMELFLKEKKYPLSDREEAFQIWTELTHFGKRHQQLKDLGTGYLSLFGESGRYDQLEAEFAYFRFYTESFFSKITDLSQLEKIVTRLSLFPGSRRTYSLALDRLGRVYFDHNRYQEALEKLQQANQIFIQNNHLLVASSNLTVQGVVYDAMEDYIASAQAYQHSNEILNQLDNKPFGTISANAYNLGLLYLDRLGDPERALPFFAEALENDRLDGGEDNFYLGDDYKMLSLAALKLGDLSLAESRARMSVSHFESIRQETSPQMATSKLQLALVLHARGKVDQAVALAEQALAILIDSENERKTDLRRPMAQTYNQLGYHQTTLGLWPEATESFAQAARLAKALGRDIFLLESLRGSLKLHLLMNQPDEARLAWLELQGILESKFAEAKVLRLEQQLNSLRIDFAKGYRPEQLLTSPR